MSIIPIITFKAGKCEIDVGALNADPSSVAELTLCAAIKQAKQSQGRTRARLYLPIRRRWYGRPHFPSLIQLLSTSQI